MGGRHVAILLATKNGSGFLNEQLRSYDHQTHRDWSLHVSDDGSSDETCTIVGKFAREGTRTVSVRDGPKQGYWQNFMSLAQDRNLKADYFAFSDQDDVWYADKLERAMNCLRNAPQNTPAMYCARTELVDENLRHLGYSPLFSQPPAFQNSLVQNIGGGNTMVFNAAAKRFLEASRNIEVASHDWWTYQIVSGTGGTVFYDSRPSLAYRQHGENIIGSNSGSRAALLRVRMILAGRLKTWNDAHLSGLLSLRAHLTAKSIATLENFVAARNARSVAARLVYLKRSGVYRQTQSSNTALVLAAALRKL